MIRSQFRSFLKPAGVWCRAFTSRSRPGESSRLPMRCSFVWSGRVHARPADWASEDVMSVHSLSPLATSAVAAHGECALCVLTAWLVHAGHLHPALSTRLSTVRRKPWLSTSCRVHPGERWRQSAAPVEVSSHSGEPRSRGSGSMIVRLIVRAYVIKAHEDLHSLPGARQQATIARLLLPYLGPSTTLQPSSLT